MRSRFFILFAALFALPMLGFGSENQSALGGGADALGGGLSSLGEPPSGAIDPTTFSLPWTTSGIDAMVAGEASADSMSLNGTNVTSMLFVRESGATSTTWAAENGPTFAITSGTATLNKPGPFVVADGLDPNSQGVGTASGAAWKKTYDAQYALGTDDVVWESVSVAGGNHMAASNHGSKGWWLQDGVSTGGYTGVVISDGVTTGSVGVASSSFSVQHIFACLDAGTALRVYQDGVLVGTDTTVPSGAIEDPGAPLCIGGYGSACTSYSAGDATHYVQVWHHPAWLSSVDDCDAKAAERFARLSGGMPDIHKGSALPTVATRASSAFIDIYDSANSRRVILPVGNNWVPRVVVRQNTNGTSRAGLLREPQATNLVLQSADLSTTWTATAASVTTDSASPPTLVAEADSVIGDGTNAAHYVSQSVTVSTATQYTLSAFAKVGDQPYVYLADSGAAASANTNGYFKLSDCTVGTKGAGADSIGAESWGSGWCRVWLTHTTVGTSSAVEVAPAAADTTLAFAGDSSTVNIYASLVQLEVSPTDDLPSSYIATTTTTVTRSEDQLRYDGIGNVPTNTHTLVASIGYTSPVNSGVSAWPYSLSVGGAGNNVCTAYYSSSNQFSTWCQTPSGIVKQVSSAALTATGNRRVFQSNWLDQGGLVELLDDGTQIASGTAAALDNPTGIDQIEIGQRESGVSEVPGSTLLSNFKIYSAAP